MPVGINWVFQFCYNHCSDSSQWNVLFYFFFLPCAYLFVWLVGLFNVTSKRSTTVGWIIFSYLLLWKPWSKEWLWEAKVRSTKLNASCARSMSRWRAWESPHKLLEKKQRSNTDDITEKVFSKFFQVFFGIFSQQLMIQENKITTQSLLLQVLHWWWKEMWFVMRHWRQKFYGHWKW